MHVCVKHDQGSRHKIIHASFCQTLTGVQKRGEITFISNPFSLRSLTFSLLVSLFVSPPPSCEDMNTLSQCSSHTLNSRGSETHWWRSEKYTHLLINLPLTSAAHQSISSGKTGYISVTNLSCRNKYKMNPCVQVYNEVQRVYFPQ